MSRAREENMVVWLLSGIADAGIAATASGPGESDPPGGEVIEKLSSDQPGTSTCWFNPASLPTFSNILC